MNKIVWRTCYTKLRETSVEENYSDLAWKGYTCQLSENTWWLNIKKITPGMESRCRLHIGDRTSIIIVVQAPLIPSLNLFQFVCLIYFRVYNFCVVISLLICFLFWFCVQKSAHLHMSSHPLCFNICSSLWFWSLWVIIYWFLLCSNYLSSFHELSYLSYKLSHLCARICCLSVFSRSLN